MKYSKEGKEKCGKGAVKEGEGRKNGRRKKRK